MLTHRRSRASDRSLLERGFTLVEILVVIVILAILAAVVVYAVDGSKQDAGVGIGVGQCSAGEDRAGIARVGIARVAPDCTRL